MKSVFSGVRQVEVEPHVTWGKGLLAETWKLELVSLTIKFGLELTKQEIEGLNPNEEAETKPGHMGCGNWRLSELNFSMLVSNKGGVVC